MSSLQAAGHEGFNPMETRMSPTATGKTGIEPRDGLSHVVGSTDLPLSDATIFGLLADTAARFSDRPEIEGILSRSKSGEYGVRTMIEELVQSEMFRTK